MPTQKYRFIVDQMLGRLAKWLRLLGFDTFYSSEIEDRELLRIAREEGRIIITRDTGLMQRREIKKGRTKAIFINQDTLDDQLKQLAQDLQITRANRNPYCAICNIPVELVEKRAVKDYVPEYVYATQKNFTKCPRCGRYYWQGTHWQHIEERLDQVFRSGEKS